MLFTAPATNMDQIAALVQWVEFPPKCPKMVQIGMNVQTMKLGQFARFHFIFCTFPSIVSAEHNISYI